MTRPEKIPAQAGFEPRESNLGSAALEEDALTTRDGVKKPLKA